MLKRNYLAWPDLLLFSPGFWQVEEVNSQHARWRARNSPTLLCATVLKKRCRENCLEANTCSRATQSLRARNKSEKIDRPIEAPDHISLTWLHSLPLGYPKGQSPILDGQKIMGQQVSQKKMIKFAWPIKMTERNGGYGGFLYLPITPQRRRFKRPPQHQTSETPLCAWSSSLWQRVALTLE